MKNSKVQIPNPKQIPSAKFQAETLAEGWHYVGTGSGGGALELNDKIGGEEKPFDLQERTAVFGEQIVRFAKQIPRTPVTDRLISQIVVSAISPPHDMTSKPPTTWLAE